MTAHELIKALCNFNLRYICWKFIISVTCLYRFCWKDIQIFSLPNKEHKMAWQHLNYTGIYLSSFQGLSRRAWLLATFPGRQKERWDFGKSSLCCRDCTKSGRAWWSMASGLTLLMGPRSENRWLNMIKGFSVYFCFLLEFVKYLTINSN